MSRPLNSVMWIRSGLHTDPDPVADPGVNSCLKFQKICHTKVGFRYIYKEFYSFYSIYLIKFKVNKGLSMQTIISKASSRQWLKDAKGQRAQISV